MQGTGATLLLCRYWTRNQLQTPSLLPGHLSPPYSSSSLIFQQQVPLPVVPGVPWLGGSVAMQVLLFLCSPWVCICCGREENPLPKLRGLSLHTGPPAHVQKPSAKWCFQLKFLPFSPSVPPPPTTPATLSLLFAINSAGPGEIGSFHPPSHSPLSLPAAMPSSLPSPCAAGPVTAMQ